MKYYLDTEFIERPCTIDLISIGIVCEDGRELYAESDEFNPSDASDWVKENVIKHLWSKQSDKSQFNGWSRDGGKGGLMSCDQIRWEISRFVEHDNPEFWGYYADYDWVVFCWLFGSMVDLPEGWPMYCRDLKQLCDSIGNPELPKQGEGEHNALEDARWNKMAHDFLLEL